MNAVKLPQKILPTVAAIKGLPKQGAKKPIRLCSHELAAHNQGRKSFCRGTPLIASLKTLLFRAAHIKISTLIAVHAKPM